MGRNADLFGTPLMGLWKQDAVEITGNDALTLTGDAICWDDMRVPINAVKLAGVNDPTWTAYSAGYLLAFAPQAVEGNEERIFFIAQLPHSYAEGEDIEFHVHWVPETDDSAAVVWKLTYEWVGISGSFSSTSLIEATQIIDTEADKHFYTDLGTITGTGMGISSCLVCELRRHSSDGSDTFDDNAYLITCDFHFPVNTFGSRTETAK